MLMPSVVMLIVAIKSIRLNVLAPLSGEGVFEEIIGPARREI